MKRSLFSGWQDVYSFTLKQAFSAKYKMATAILAVFILVGGMALSIIMALVEQSEATEISPIEKVYVINESDLEHLPLENFEQSSKEAFPTVSFEVTDESVKALNERLSKDAGKDIILQIKYEEEGYKVSAILPYNTELSRKDGEDLAEAFTQIIEQGKILSSGITAEKLMVILSGNRVSYLEAGQREKSLGEELIAMMGPMVCCMVIYFLVFIYGQGMGNIVSVEKSSKLMEMMLTLTRPYGIIAGKILAMITAAFLQMAIWIICIPIGLIGGHLIAANFIYDDYINHVFVTIEAMQATEGATAFSGIAILFTLVVICISFVFYCVLAAMIASFASKAEELAQVMSIYMMIVVFAWMGAYIIPLQENPVLNDILRFFPLTGAFLLPGDILVGNVAMWKAVVCTVILLACTVAVILLAGKIYKNQLFYRGKSLVELLNTKKKKNEGV